jgi:RNAse (barnase) inhibitor barstar
MNIPDKGRLSYMDDPLAKSNLSQDGNNSHLFGKPSTESGNLDKIRDILFGNQIRDYEQRFVQLEERLVKECNDLQENTTKRLDYLENYIKSEVDSFLDRLKIEQTKRDESVNQLSQEFKTLINTLSKKVTQLDEQTAQSQREIRQQILEQSKNLDNDIRQKSQEMLTVLERETKELRTGKTDRSTLADLFAELAVRLNNDS